MTQITANPWCELCTDRIQEGCFGCDAIQETFELPAYSAADMPSRIEIVEAFADYVMFNPASILYDLLVALRRRGVNDSIVESVQAHLPMAGD